jgi:hypothetical protein
MLGLDAAGLRRARLRGQLLSGARPRDVGEVVRTVVGVQAQDRRAAALALRVRSTAVTAPDVDAAWAADGPLVLTWTLRGTRHLHHVDDVRWMLAIAGPAFSPGSPARSRQLGIAGEVGDRAVRALGDALRRRGALTRPQVAEILARHGIDASGQAPIHVIRRAALEGVLCVVPSPGGDETYVAFDDRVPSSREVDPEAALTELARRFLRGYGPATPADLAAWSGLPRRTAEAAWSSLIGELVEVEVTGGRAWMRRGDVRSRRAAAGRPAPLRLLPAFDALLLGYADRTPFVPTAYARRVNAGGGMIRPTVLADPGVVGTWSIRRGQIEVAPFAALDAEIRLGIERETSAVERFLPPVRRGDPAPR